MKKVAILGPYGVGNLGDAAILESTIQIIRRYHPDVSIIGINMNPGDTLRRHRIESFPTHWWYRKAEEDNGPEAAGDPSFEGLRRIVRRIRVLQILLRGARAAVLGTIALLKEVRFLLESYKQLKGFDLVIVNGSGQLCDLWGGPWLHPYGLFKWAVLAKARGTRFVVISTGAGPIDSALSRYFIRKSLILADYRSFRNEKSKQIVESLGVTGENRIYPDIAFGYPIDRWFRQEADGCRQGRVVGINPMAYCDPRCWPKQDGNAYRKYIRRLASVGAWISRRNYSVLWFSSAFMDQQVIEDIGKILREEMSGEVDRALLRPRVESVDDLLRALSGIDFVVGTRLHCLLLASLLKKPLIGISPHPKVDSLLESLGLSEYRLDISTFDLESFRPAFLSLERSREAIEDCLAEKTSEFRRKLDMQFDLLFRSTGVA